MRFIALLITLLVFTGLQAQVIPNQAASQFQSRENPYYWKNKKPHAAYWQQDVDYSINARLDDSSDRLKGAMELIYSNNSPDTLHQLVFHLYQNAFDSGSYVAQMHDRKPRKTDKPFQSIKTSNWSVNQVAVDVTVDNTVLFIELPEALLPGEKLRVSCEFQTQFGKVHGRMKVYDAWGYKHYNVVHWYPRISVYDRKFGWTTDQHLGHEFYGDFGSFRVNLDLPAHYVLDGTGLLLNREEVLPAGLMEKLAIERFKDKPWNESPSEIIAPSSERKTWRFEAQNVHDFAWTADPTYRIGSAVATLQDGREVMCYALAQEPHASGWQNAASYTASIIELYSKDFGKYAYHKMIVADARDGMEYPMLTLDGGRDPSYRGLLAHEVGHNWFFGMVGNNETYRASLDEGFTQFLTAWALTELEGDTLQVGTRVLGIEKPFQQRLHQRDRSVYYGYYYAAIMRGESPRLNTHSDQFEQDGDYGQVYSKTATMLYNLQYVLGEELFLKAMQHYFDQWKFCHPYFDDFRNSMIHYTKVDLNWFFDQWLESSETIDYGIERVKRLGKHRYALTFERRGMQMPLDVRIEDRSGEVYDIHIPNTYFHKETEAEVLPRWYGWGDFNTSYTAEISLKDGLRDVHIDPSGRLADVYQLDNHHRTPSSFDLNDFQRGMPDQTYKWEWNPLLWYNGYDGLKLGTQLKGAYFETYHKIDFKLWWNSGFGQQQDRFTLNDRTEYNRVNFDLTYVDPLRGISESLDYIWKARYMEGLFANSIFIQKRMDDGRIFDIGIGGLYRKRREDLLYLHDTGLWNEDQWNNFAEASYTKRYVYWGRSQGAFKSLVRSPFLFSDYNYGYLRMEAVNHNRFSRFNWKTRLFAQSGYGNNWAPESQLYLAGANAEEMMENPLTRSVGFVPQDFYGYGVSTGSFQVGGGLNLRGYNNYLLPEYNGDSLLRFGAQGHSGLAFNTEFEFDDLIKVLPRYASIAELKTYLFADAGLININRTNEPLELSNVRADAGVGVALDIKRWGRLSDLNPVRLRLDMPLFLNRPPAGEECFAFRWLIGFDRAF